MILARQQKTIVLFYSCHVTQFWWNKLFFMAQWHNLHPKSDVLTFLFFVVVGDVLRAMPNKGSVTQFMNTTSSTIETK
jgi:hypothetical protein